MNSYKKPGADVNKDENDMISVLKSLTFEGRGEKTNRECQLKVLHAMEES